jgi:hypothetical protein
VLLLKSVSYNDNSSRSKQPSFRQPSRSSPPPSQVQRHFCHAKIPPHQARELTSGLQAHATPADSTSPTTLSLLGVVSSFSQTGIKFTPCQITIATSRRITAILVHPTRLIRRIRFPREMGLFVLMVVFLMEDIAMRGVGCISVVTEQL